MKKHLITAAVTTGLVFTALGAANADQSSYTVQSGDSLWKISQTYHVTIDQLKTWNQLSSDTIYVNQNLSIVPPPSSSQTNTNTTPAAVNTIYTVKSGDCLSAIAKTYNTTVGELESINGLTSDMIQIGQQLKIPSSLSSTVSTTSNTPASTTYTVQSGDCLSVIAARNNISVTDLKSLNNLTTDTIYVGQVLKISGTAASAPAPASSTAATPVPTTTPVPAPAPAVSAASKAQAVIDEAQKYIGVPYLWGGSTPAGFDCSGFVNYVFNKVGITIPRTAATIWAATTPVSTPSPGDLVFFETYQTGPSHVGIYLGNNKFISAASTGVTISDMTSTYWSTRYLGAKTAL